MRTAGLVSLILAAVVGCGGSSATALVTTKGVLLIAFDRDGHLYSIDIATGAAGPVLQTFIDLGAGVEKIGVVSSAIFNPQNGVMWLGTGGNAASPGSILQLELASGEGFLVADNSAETSGIPGLTVDTSGAIYTFEGDGDRLLMIDPGTGVATEVGTMVGGSRNGFGTTFANGELFFAGGQSLFTIDRTTAVETEVAEFLLTGFPATTAGGYKVLALTTAPNGTTYALVQDDQSVEPQTHLATLNLTTAVLTHVGRTSNRLDGLVYADLTAVVPIDPAARLRHDYQLNNSFDDARGGPALVPNGGVLGATGYTFDALQGLTLSNGINPDEYSIEMRFTLDAVDAFRKLIDYAARTADAGIYVSDGIACVFDEGYGPDGAFTAGVSAHVVVTRTRFNVVAVYVDGVLQVTLVDCDEVTAANAVDTMLYFMQDDTVNAGEDATGFLDFIRIYNGVLKPAQVVSLRDGGAPPQ